jgi:hypothetical protein
MPPRPTIRRRRWKAELAKPLAVFRVAFGGGMQRRQHRYHRRAPRRRGSRRGT